MAYGDLTDAEKAHWNEFTMLRGISDWPGFSKAQNQRKDDSNKWIRDRVDYIEACAKGEVSGQKTGWNIANRKARFDFLKTRMRGAPRHEVRLPCPPKATVTEKSYIEEREVWFWVMSTTEEQKARKLACSNWLVSRRKQLFGLIKNSSAEENKRADRSGRYRALCIATRYGTHYTKWKKEHNKWGIPLAPEKPKDFRAEMVKHMRTFIGVHERPKGSNRGSPQPSGWQKRVFGGDGVAWCACFAVCMAWDTGIKGSGTASVFLNMDLAKRGQGIYRGFTTDPNRVRAGDHSIISCSTCHTGVVENAPYGMIEGNTSASSGNNFNGGEVARHNRKGKIVGWCLIRDPA